MCQLTREGGKNKKRETERERGKKGEREKTEHTTEREYFSSISSGPGPAAALTALGCRDSFYFIPLPCSRKYYYLL